jgi:DNA repair photolyase
MSVIYKPAGRAGEYSEWAVNLYGGCEHGCIYCYVPAARRIKPEVFYGQHRPYNDVLKKLAADCKKLQGTISTPIMFSFTSDAYQPGGDVRATTREAVRLLKAHGFRVCILTKGGLRATADFDLLDGRDIMACSLTMLDPKMSLAWEPGAALPAERIELLRQAKSKGMETWASLEPVVYPDQTLEIIRQTAGFVDLYKIGTLNYHPAKNRVDWPKFCADAVQACTDAGAAYYLKDDLFKFAAPGVEKNHNPNGRALMHEGEALAAHVA